MKLYYKLIKDETNKIIEIQSSNIKYTQPGDLVTNEENILKNFKPLKSTIENVPHYVVDDKGFCPLYEETRND
jgi:hypothetical protein